MRAVTALLGRTIRPYEITWVLPDNERPIPRVLVCVYSLPRTPLPRPHLGEVLLLDEAGTEYLE